MTRSRFFSLSLSQPRAAPSHPLKPPALASPPVTQATIATTAPPTASTTPTTSTASPEVTPSDQAAINEFNRAFAARKELAARVKASEASLADLEDASLEVGLGDPDVPVRMVVGECFVHLVQGAAEARVEGAAVEARAEGKRLEEEVGKLEARMGELKKGLYSKFGNSINLEE